MNTFEYKQLAYDIVPNLQKKLDNIGNGNVAVVLKDNLQSHGVVYVGVSGDNNAMPYEAYIVKFENSPFNDGKDTVYWDFAGYNN